MMRETNSRHYSEAGSPMTLGILFFGADSRGRLRAAPNLSSGSDEVTQLVSLEEGERFLKTSEERHLLLIVRHPVEMLAGALSEDPGKDLTTHLEVMRDYILSVLCFVRTHRRDVTLIDERALLSAPEDVGAKLEDLRGVSISVSNVKQRECRLPEVLELCLAELLLSRHPLVRQLFSEFEAALLPPSGEDSMVTFRDAVAAFRSSQETAKKSEDLKEALASLKKDFVVTARNETKYSQRNLALLREIAMLSRKHEDSINEFLRLEAGIVRLEKAHGQLKEQYAAQQQKLAAYISKRNFHRSRRLVAEAQAAGLKNEINEVYRSRSWRLTAPLRYIKFKLGQFRGS